jgi:tRNA A-37 threonylcarbamoyl transferase component Bud32
MDGESVLRPGYRLDRYELLCPVASGGMAQVWLARLRGKRDFEKLYAIKTIKTELGDDERFQEMFLDEARIASGIEHPNVAHILDLGEQDGILYIVMEWVDGEALAKITRQARKVASPLPLGVSLRIMADACAGLHAAHELKDRKGIPLGVIHRDVSPQNILVATNGAVKVIDFGVAKARNRRAGETGEGIVKGKIRFMAPEQVRAQALDRRVDVWAVGVCLHELATGKLPFDSESDVDVVRRLISDEPPPPFDGIPAPVAEILRHSLVRDPDERFATASAMRRAIENAMAELKMRATSEDVADFVRTNLPEFAEKRHAVMAKAMAAADARGSSASLVAAEELQPEAAYAATIVSEREPRVGQDRVTRPDPKPAQPVPLTNKKMPSARALLEGRVPADESVGGAFTDEEVAGLPKRRGVWWLVAFGAIVAGAWLAWPHGGRLRKFFAHDRPAPTAKAPPTSSASASGAPSASASSATSATSSPAVSATASVKPTAAPTESAAHAAPATTHTHTHTSSQDVSFTPAPTMQVTPTATTAPPPTVTQAPPPPPPPPTATQTSAPPPESNNPY